MRRARPFRPPILVLATNVFVLAAAGDAMACACCSNEGQRFVETEAINAYAAGLIGDLKFAGDAKLFTGEADPEYITGVTATSTDFRLDVAKSEDRWIFKFSDEKNSGELTFKLPRSITRFEVDPREFDAQSQPNGPTLYKEWRLTAKAVGSGLLKGAASGDQRATLIFHGQGNSCTDASQFTAWTLVLHGSKANVTFFGKLVP